MAQKLRLIGFSCTHYGDRQGHDADLWKEFLREVETTDNAAVFGLGDYLDWIRTSYRVPLKSSFGEDDKAFSQLDDMVMESLVIPFVDTVKTHCPSFARKCVGLIEGNHHGRMLSSRFRNGRTTTEEICERLGVPYLGLSAWVRLTVYRSAGTKKFGTGHNLNLLLNHSVSRSGKLAASLNAAQKKLEGWRGVDVFLTANDHQLGHVLRQEIGCAQRGEPRMVEYQQVIAKVGAFQKGYQMGADSDNYVEKSLLNPGQLGWMAFDAWVYSKPSPRGMIPTKTPEVWRFGNFNF